jgi:hypothetical protein
MGKLSYDCFCVFMFRRGWGPDHLAVKGDVERRFGAWQGREPLDPRAQQLALKGLRVDFDERIACFNVPAFQERRQGVGVDIPHRSYRTARDLVPHA